MKIVPTKEKVRLSKSDLKKISQADAVVGKNLTDMIFMEFYKRVLKRLGIPRPPRQSINPGAFFVGNDTYAWLLELHRKSIKQAQRRGRISKELGNGFRSVLMQLAGNVGPVRYVGKQEAMGMFDVIVLGDVFEPMPARRVDDSEWEDDTDVWS